MFEMEKIMFKMLFNLKMVAFKVFFIQIIVSEIIFNLDTFNLEDLVKVQSARTAIGHDADGRLILVEIDGKTHQR